MVILQALKIVEHSYDELDPAKMNMIYEQLVKVCFWLLPIIGRARSLLGCGERSARVSQVSSPCYVQLCNLPVIPLTPNENDFIKFSITDTQIFNK